MKKCVNNEINVAQIEKYSISRAFKTPVLSPPLLDGRYLILYNEFIQYLIGLLS
jgi:hypothetical protein